MVSVLSYTYKISHVAKIPLLFTICLIPKKEMKKLTFALASQLAFKKFGNELGMFGYLCTKSGNVIYGKFISYGLNKVITKKELLA